MRLNVKDPTKIREVGVDENALSNLIIGAAIEVHRQLGPGLLESAYESALAYEFTLRDIPHERQKPVPVVYKDVQLDCDFRLDFLVGGLVVVELKAVEALLPVHEAQVITYLKLTGCKLGMLFNFNVRLMRDGIHRVAYHL
jgi:GxxExxY protein